MHRGVLRQVSGEEPCRRRLRRGLGMACTVCALAGAAAASEPAGVSVQQEAVAALRRGVDYFRREVAAHGGYLWQYSEDLTRREGEGAAGATRVWVQPPGTPAVGSALLAAFEATNDHFYLEAVKETAEALLRGQLQSGGWYYYIDFDPAARRKLAYRIGGRASARNTTTLDDDTTQSALRFLMQADRALGFRDAAVHEAVGYALDNLFRAQYPNGAWPQTYDRFPRSEEHPVKPAAFPQDWPRAHPGGAYGRFYTLNDNVASDMINTLLEGATIYGDTLAGPDGAGLAARCLAAAERTGRFLLQAQMPQPQPAWAQQYDFAMHPAWARKFEPPAISGGESQGVLRVLMRLYRHTGDTAYLDPVPPALQYLRSSRLPDGQLARFYELGTNRPLYFTRQYELTYRDDDLPTHYAFKVADQTEAIAREYEQLRQRPEGVRGGRLPADTPRTAEASGALEAAVRRILASQDARGRWIEDGPLRYQPKGDATRRVIRCETFIHNVQTLSRYLRAVGTSRAAQ